MTLVVNIDLDIIKMYVSTTMKFLAPAVQMLQPEQTDRQRDRQTDRQIDTHVCRQTHLNLLHTRIRGW